MLTIKKIIFVVVNATDSDFKTSYAWRLFFAYLAKTVE
jgi:hypothetical protein